MDNNFENEYKDEEIFEPQEEPFVSQVDTDDLEFDAQEITIPSVSHSQINPSAKGLRIFCIILAAVIALSCTAVS